MTCPACDGRGSVACYAGLDDFGNAEYLAVDCPECDAIPTAVDEEDTDGTRSDDFWADFDDTDPRDL